MDDLLSDQDKQTVTEASRMPSERPGDNVLRQAGEEGAPEGPLSEVPLPAGGARPQESEHMVIVRQNNIAKKLNLRPPRVMRGTILDDMLVLCAEPGMGKSYVAQTVTSIAKEQGYLPYRFALDDMSSEKACKRMVRICREVAEKMTEGNKCLLVVDGVAPGDEYETTREARALERLQSAACQVIVCLRPESEQLAEEISTCCRFATDDLLFVDSASHEPAYDLTGGIPALVEGLSLDEQVDGLCRPGSRYLSALDDLIALSFRNGLPAEEQRLRFAAMLIGSGSVDDLSLAAGRCDAEQLAWLDRDVPLIEVERQTQSFSVHGLKSDDVFSACMSGLQAVAAEFPQVVVAATGILARRGMIRRSAMVCALCSSEGDLASLGIRWGVEYVAAGETGLVSEALKMAKETGRVADSRTHLAESALYELSGTMRQVEAARESLAQVRLAGSGEVREHQSVMLLGACRDMAVNPQRAAGYLSVSPDNEMGAFCLDHLSVVRLLLGGRFNDAYAALGNEMLPQEVSHIAAALIYDDLQLALLMSGGVPDVRETHHFAQAQRFYVRAKLNRHQAYHAALCALPRILMTQERDTMVLEEATSRAERMGDQFLQALFLSVMAVGDLRRRAWSRAHVRAERTAAMARALGIEYVASSAELVDALALELLGERGALGRYCEWEGRPEGLALLGGIAAREVGESSDGAAGLVASEGMPCPRDELWAIGILAFDCQALSESILGGMPSAWLDLLRAVRSRQEPFFRGEDSGAEPGSPEVAPAPPQGPTPSLHSGEQRELLPATETAKRVRISILGGFAVEVDGRPVANALLERRRARDFITLLAIAPGHRVRRYQAIDILWPEADYFRGPRKLYEATGEARKQLGHRLEGLNPITADRSQGTVGFDNALVRCDVDDFEHEARLTLSENGDDFWVLDHARRMESLYAGGPDPHLAALGEQVADRIEELKTLYVDGAVAAGEAALRLGRAKLAVRYAMDAHRMRELREDVMILLVQALRASGRGFEVPALFRRYSRHLIEAEGVPPSLALRRAVSLATEEGPHMP